ncbi:hypothetical protein KIKIMORA_02900 [Brevundimonas phage vB_BpoS-Kikimora]|uniref:Uncharacterized protein n=1 Tax=Brevundimonas phage vB_BpoS-Kikimora TaxID=2948601 RepID=A0A9E7MRC2_9CAUD|nr:hypothetical protein KIKIMORA_02900 [Brevundimonas phage vB_BpoS-Kikimora]
MTPFPYGVEGLSTGQRGLVVHIDQPWLKESVRRALAHAEAEFAGMARPQHSNTPYHTRWSSLRHDLRILQETMTWLETLPTR